MICFRVMDTAHAKIAESVRDEFHKHRFDTFVDEPPCVAQGGKGVVVPGCAVCKIQIQTVERFLSHVCEKVLETFEKFLKPLDE